MWMRKIVYITHWKDMSGKFIDIPEKNTRSIVNNIFEWGTIGIHWDILEIMKQESPLTSHNLSDFPVDYNGTIEETKENMYLSLISEPRKINKIMNAKENWKTKIVVIKVTQENLKNILDALKEEWYDVVNKDKIKHISKTYAVIIDPEYKKSNFSENTIK